MMGTGFGGWGGSGLLGGISLVAMVTILLLAIGLIVWLVAGSTRRQGDRSSDTCFRQGTVPAAGSAPQVTTSARAMLDARYARGEMDRDEYLRCRADLV
jgi:putative membrane protein